MADFSICIEQKCNWKFQDKSYKNVFSSVLSTVRHYRVLLLCIFVIYQTLVVILSSFSLSSLSLCSLSLFLSLSLYLSLFLARLLSLSLCLCACERACVCECMCACVKDVVVIVSVLISMISWWNWSAMWRNSLSNSYWSRWCEVVYHVWSKDTVK